MDTIRRTAFLSIARGTAFTALAIFTLMIGLSFDPAMASRTGGVLTLITSIVLVLKARRAPMIDHRQTELWLMLDKDQRPPPELAQRLTAGALEEAYTVFAAYAAATAASLFALAMLAALIVAP
jgi:hypothetical protein